jgi:hypothetical protein
MIGGQSDGKLVQLKLRVELPRGDHLQIYLVGEPRQFFSSARRLLSEVRAQQRAGSLPSNQPSDPSLADRNPAGVHVAPEEAPI